MKSPAQMSRTAVLTEAAIMIAMGFVLSLIPVIELPWGGSVTMVSTLPILVFSLRHKTSWGVGVAAVFAFTQLMDGFGNVLYAKTYSAMVLSALLDYILAYTLLGFAGVIARKFKNRTFGIAASVTITGLLRLGCSFLSGVIVWSEWAPEGTPVWLYSITYNSGWLLPDLALVLVAVLILSKVSVLNLLPAKAAE